MLKTLRSLASTGMRKTEPGHSSSPEKPKIPVTLVTGFLGSGKTTLINAVLREPAFAGTLVIVNEFGEIGLDNALIAGAQDGVVLLESGCLCCAASGTLRDTLIDLFAQRRTGMLSQVRHIIVETSGLANPGPLIATLIGDSALVPRVSLAQVITLVDALNADTTLETYSEARHQVAFADILVLTKWEQSQEEQTELLMEQISALNHDALVLKWAPHESALAIFEAESESALQGTDAWIARLMRSGSADGIVTSTAEATAPSLFDSASNGHGARLHGVTHSSAFADVTTCTLRFSSAPLTWEAYGGMVAALTAHYGRRLLRCKGLLQLGHGADNARMHVIQGVQGYFAPPYPMPEHQNPIENFLVFILDDVRPKALRALLATLPDMPTFVELNSKPHSQETDI